MTWILKTLERTLRCNALLFCFGGSDVPAFKVWEVGCSEMDAEWIDALSVQDAAEQWGRDADVQSGVFAIGHGQQQVALNVMPEATGIPEQIRVSGDVCFQYFTVPVESK